jgi:DNA repair photolyase
VGGRQRGTLPEGVIAEPRPHLVTPSTKQLHGWPPGRRECTSERLLINPYNGCSHDCPFCYAHALPGRFATFVQHGVVTVCEGFDRTVGEQLDSLLLASCGYLSPVTDPFQPLDERYRLSVKIIRQFVRRGLPIEFVTKGRVPDEALEAMRGHRHCFGQVSLITLDERLHRILAPGAPAPAVLLDNIRRIRQAGLYAVARVDPVIPSLTDEADALGALVGAVKAAGAQHLVASCMDIPTLIRNQVLDRLSLAVPGPERGRFRRDIEGLYREQIGSSRHAATGYRRDLFGLLRRLAAEAGLSFALCMEYVLPAAQAISAAGADRGARGLPEGLNRQFATSRSCEGLDVPMYARNSRTEEFRPIASCDGACLLCTEETAKSACGLPELAGGRALSLADYRRLGGARA